MAKALPELSEQTRKFDNKLEISIARGGKLLGGDVWKSAHCLARYLAANPELVRGARIVELGAGTGYLSMSAHLLGSSLCVSTDRGDVLGLMKENMEVNAELLARENPSGRLVRAWLDWDEVRETGALPEADFSEFFDLVLACDCLFQSSHAQSLLAVLELLCNHDADNAADAERTSSVLLCQSFRAAPDVESALFEGAARAGFLCALVSEDDSSPDRAALKSMNVAIWKLWKPMPSAPPPCAEDVRAPTY